jgi:hypothetical protein
MVHTVPSYMIPMKNIITVLLNSIILFAIIFLTIAITVYSLNKKEIKVIQAIHPLKGTVSKEVVRVGSDSVGVVKEIPAENGDIIHKGDTIAVIVPELTHSTTSKSKQLSIDDEIPVVSPSNGVITEINAQVGSPAASIYPLITLYSNDTIRMTSSLSDDEYKKIQHMKHILAYSERLSQGFEVTPDFLNPTMNQNDLGQQQMSLTFKFVDSKEASSLLDGEKLSILLPTPSQSHNIMSTLTSLITNYRFNAP